MSNLVQKDSNSEATSSQCQTLLTLCSVACQLAAFVSCKGACREQAGDV